MPYDKTNWQNLPNTSTPINATNLNKIEDELEKLGGITITEEGTSCNDYMDEGIYWFSSSNVLPSNRPADIYGWLEVIASPSNIKQYWHRSSVINNSSEFQTFVRFYNASAQTWSNWKKFAMGEIFEDTTQEIPSNSDLDNYITPGTYKCPNSTIAGTLTNCPSTVGFKLVVECISASNRYRQTIYANRVSGDMTYVRHNSGSWGAWHAYQMVEDSGWIDLEVNSGFTTNALASSGKLMYRKINGIVYLKGSVKGFTSFSQACATLPSGYRPATRIDFYGTYAGTKTANCTVSSNGNINLLNNQDSSIADSNWVAMCASWIADN